MNESLHLLGRVHVPADRAAIPVVEIHGKLSVCGRELPLRRTERRMEVRTFTARGERAGSGLERHQASPGIRPVQGGKAACYGTLRRVL